MRAQIGQAPTPKEHERAKNDLDEHVKVQIGISEPRVPGAVWDPEVRHFCPERPPRRGGRAASGRQRRLQRLSGRARSGPTAETRIAASPARSGDGGDPLVERGVSRRHSRSAARGSARSAAVFLSARVYLYG